MYELRTVAGSRLYGTSVEGSDSDFKMVIRPTAKEVLLGKAEFSSHTIQEDDDTSWSYQKWMKLLLKMDSNAYEILLSPEFEQNNLPTEFFPTPQKILQDRREAAIGFANSSINRYSLRGERLKVFYEVLETLKDSFDIEEAASSLAGTDGVLVTRDPHGVKLLSVFAKSIPFTAKKSEAIALYERATKNASKRAVESIDSKDWKGVMHALRIVKQMQELVLTGYVEFPLRDREFYLKIRNGQVDEETALWAVEQAIDELANMPKSKYLASGESAAEYAEEMVLKYHKWVVDNA